MDNNTNGKNPPVLDSDRGKIMQKAMLKIAGKPSDIQAEALKIFKKMWEQKLAKK